jgi:hypothetical protein
MLDNAYITPKKSRQRTGIRQVTLSGQVSTSVTPSQRSRLSEKRYALESDPSLMREVCLAESSPERSQVVSAKELFTEQPLHTKINYRHRRAPTLPEARAVPLKLHARSSSHQRKPSICFLPGKTLDQVVSELDLPKSRGVLKLTPSVSSRKNVSFSSEVEDTTRKSRASSHARTASDMDSVILEGPEELLDHLHTDADTRETGGLQNSPQQSLTDSLEESREIPSRSYAHKTTVTEVPTWGRRSEEAVRLSLPVFGPMPVTAYCPHCNLQVHTSIRFNEDPGVVWSLWNSVFACCAVPSWVGRMHYCSNCRSLLAKTG